MNKEDKIKTNKKEVEDKNRKVELEKVKVGNEICKVLDKTKDKVLVEIDIMNINGVKETVKQWYMLNSVTPVR